MAGLAMVPVGALLVDAQMRSSLPSKVTLELKKASREHRKTLLVYLPGILAGAERSSEGLIDVWRRFGDVLLVECDGERFRADEVISSVTAWVSLNAYRYDDIVFIGSSMGGLLTNDIVQQLGPGNRAKVTPVLLDAPTSARDFQPPNDKLSQLMRGLPFGPVWDVFSHPIMNALMVPPKDANIEPGVNRKQLERRFKEMTDYPLSFYRDQVMYIITHGRLAANSLADVKQLVYVRSMWDNDTVRPTALEAWWKAFGRKPKRYKVLSAHVAFAEQPTAWRKMFEQLLSELLG